MNSKARKLILMAAVLAIETGIPALAKAQGDPPTIAVQPQPQVVLAGLDTSFRVGVSGSSPLVIQWHKAGVVLADGERVTGPTNTALFLRQLTLADSGDYRVVITNAYGSVTSAVATLSVVPAVTFAPAAAWPGFRRGPVTDVQLVGNLAYALVGRALQVFDLSDPRNPQRLAGHESSGPLTGLCVVGDTAYVTDLIAGLLIFDVSDLLHPQISGSYQPAGYARNVVVDWNTAYLAMHDRGLVVVDISVPGQPREIGQLRPGGIIHQIQVAGTVAYLAAGLEGIKIVSVANPAAPVLLSALETAGEVRSLHMASNFLYVADSSESLQFPWMVQHGEGLVVVNVTDPVTPFRVATFDTLGSLHDVQVVGSTALLADAKGLIILDVSNPSAPSAVTSWPTGGDGLAVDVAGPRAAMADGTGGLAVFELNDPRRPNLLATVRTAGFARALDVDGENIYVADDVGGLEIFTFNVPAGLSHVGSYQEGGRIVDVRVEEGFAYLAVDGNQDSDEDGDTYYEIIQAVDVRNPAAPEELASNGWTDDEVEFLEVKAIGVANQTAYVLFNWSEDDDDGCDNRYTMMAFDASNPDNLETRWRFTRKCHYAYDMQLVGQQAYVAGVLDIFDLSDPNSPRQIYDSHTYGAMTGMHVAGGYAYLGQLTYGVRIYDVRVPEQTAYVTNFDTPGVVYGVDVAGHYAYVADGTNGVLVLDVSQPAAPVRVGHHLTGGDAQAIRVLGNYAYVADGDGGIQVLEILGIPPTPPSITAGPYDLRVEAGSPATFSVKADGHLPFGYQWFKDDMALTESAHFQGVRSPRLTIANAGLADAGTYTVQLTNVAGSVRSAPAQLMIVPGTDLTLVGGWPGYIREAPSMIVVEGNRAYLASDGGALTIMDISDPAAPVVVGGPHTVVDRPGDGDIENMDVAGGLAYLAVESDGLLVVDVRDPAQPVRLGRHPGDAQAIHVIGTRAYLGIDQEFQIIDVSNPTNLVLVGQVGLGDYPEDVFVTNDLACVLLESGWLQVIDVSDPAVPTRTGSCRLPLPAHDIGVCVAGSYAYVADSAAGLQIVNVSNPASPFIAGQHRGAGYAMNVQVAGDHAYVAAYGSGLLVFEVGNPTAPFWLGTCATNPLPFDVAVQGNTAYIVGASEWWVVQGNTYQFVRGESLVALDITNPTNLTRVGGFVGVSGDSFAVHVVGNLAGLADTSGGARLLDLTVPARPQLLATIETRGSAWGGRLAGHHLYVTDDRGLQIFDVSEPATPVFLGAFATPNRCMELEIAGRYAYVTGSDAVLKILDLSQPAQPLLVGEYWPGRDSEGIQLVGHLAFVAAGSLGLQILDVSNPTAPRLLGSYPGRDADDVAVSGNLAFIADENGMVILDVSNPAAPAFLAMAVTGEEAEGVGVVDDLVFVTDEEEGFFVFNVSDPRHPVQVAHYPTFDAQDVAFAGNLVFVADGVQGLLVFAATGLAPSPPVITASPRNQSAVPGQNAAFTVNATGNPPLSYQWLKHGVPIAGATQSSLILSNVSAAAAADYSVIVGNAFGFTLSDAATLVIDLPFQLVGGRSTNGALSVTVHGCPMDGVMVLEVSTNLVDWEPVFMLTAPVGVVELAFPMPARSPARFYRAQWR